MIWLVVALVVAVGAEDELDYRKLYQETVQKYHSQFLLSSSPDVAKEHFAVFKEHVKDIVKHNHEQDKEWEAEINEFALETDAELKQHLGLNISTLVMEEKEELTFTKREIEEIQSRSDTEVDYTDKLPAIKNQGGCGSCWTFGAVAALEYQANKDRKGQMKSLSEQQYLDCVYEGKRNGCSGGWPTDCYTWSSKHTSHIASTANYPYTGRDGSCKYSSKKNALSGWSVRPGARYVRGDKNVVAAVGNSKLGVMSVAIAVVSDFYSYKTGVYSSDSCNKISINHAVNIVGYGVHDSIPYWRVRNSWGAWGDGGYVKMKRGAGSQDLNMCQISQYAHYPMISGADDGKGDDTDDGGEDEGEDTVDEWCEHKDKVLKTGYSGGSRIAMNDLKEAKSACGSRSDCGGVTTEKSLYTLRKGSDLVEKVGATSYTSGACEKTCSWIKIDKKRLNGSLSKMNLSMTAAKAKCLGHDKCVAITCRKKKCRLVSTTSGTKSAKFIGYKYECTA